MSLELLSYGAFFLTMALSFAIICLGLNVQWGQTGVFNVGVSGFVAVGAYTSALLTTPPSPDHLGGFPGIGAGVRARPDDIAEDVTRHQFAVLDYYPKLAANRLGIQPGQVLPVVIDRTLLRCIKAK